MLQTAQALAPQAERQFLSGNEAVARGAWEAGLSVAAAYPGTPATEILEALATLPEVYAEWSTNEKVALEVAIGASLAGRRSLCSMKHVGVNVASDSLMSLGLTGIRAGFVLAVADDVGFASSQNEQDSRYWGRFVHLPVLEPADAVEAYEMARAAFDISERHEVPVILRLTTRVAHVRRAVTVGTREIVAPVAYQKDIARFVITPDHVGQRLKVRDAREAAMLAETETSGFNTLQKGTDARVGFVVSGPAYHLVRERFPEAPVLKLGFSHPLPTERVRGFAATVERVLVVEEVEPLMERELRAAAVPVHGKLVLPGHGEMTIARLEQAVDSLLGAARTDRVEEKQKKVFPRPPTLCVGCPYLGVYFWLSRLTDAVIAGDIGCYSLGVGEPWNAMDSIISMGASLGMAHGLAKSFHGKDKKRPVVAVIGDSTFLHSGMSALANITYHGSNVTVLLLDNRVTAMTGGQNNPANGRGRDGEPAPRIDFEQLVIALGVKPERVRKVDPYELPAFFRALREETKAEEPSVIVTTRPCVLGPDFKRTNPLKVEEDACNGCARCLDVGCPAITVTRREQKQRGEGKVVELSFVTIDTSLCTGCNVCQQACARGAIVPAKPQPVSAS